MNNEPTPETDNFADGLVCLTLKNQYTQTEINRRTFEFARTLEHKLSAAKREIEELRSQHIIFGNDLLNHKQTLKVAAKALNQLWEDDEMGWVTDSNCSECVKCGAQGLTALPLIHNEGCVQGYIAEALANPIIQQALKEE